MNLQVSIIIIIGSLLVCLTSKVLTITEQHIHHHLIEQIG